MYTRQLGHLGLTLWVPKNYLTSQIGSAEHCTKYVETVIGYHLTWPFRHVSLPYFRLTHLNWHFRCPATRCNHASNIYRVVRMWLAVPFAVHSVSSCHHSHCQWIPNDIYPLVCIWIMTIVDCNWSSKSAFNSKRLVCYEDGWLSLLFKRAHY